MDHGAGIVLSGGLAIADERAATPDAKRQVDDPEKAAAILVDGGSAKAALAQDARGIAGDR